jgi:LacI family transcriptional regulator
LVLSGKGDRLGISGDTADRIREVARELGYYTNRQIRALLSGRTGCIGLYLRNDQWGTCYGYWSSIRAAIEKAASARDLLLMVYCGRQGATTEESFERQAGGVVDGVITLNSAKDPIAGRLLETHIPAVEIGDPQGPLPYVAPDSPDGIRQALEHLRDRGYRNPCFLNFPSPYFATVIQRTSAFRHHSEKLFGRPGPTAEAKLGVAALDAVLALDGVDSVVCVSDEHAYALLETAPQRGVRIPQDLAVIGFDALPTFGGGRIATSIQTPLEEIASAGLDTLLAAIEGGPAPQATVLPVSLRVGDTT